MRKIFLLGLACLALTSPVFAASQSTEGSAQKVYNAESFVLNNGMQVVVIPNHRAPVVSHMVWYKVGAADEPQGDGVSGAAHFLEHLMFKGTKAIAPGQFSKIIRAKGGEDNAFTSWDFTAYFQSVAKDLLPMVMAMEADRMINLSLPEKEVLSEREVIIEERRQRTDNDPKALFSEQMRAVLFATSPYAVPIIGWRDEMPKLVRAHLEAYYKTWYAPNNAILVVSGDVTMDQVRPLAEKYYGIIPAYKVPDHIRPSSPDFSAPAVLTLHDETIRQSVFLRAWRAPSQMQDKPTADALSVLQETLGGGAATQLYQSLVVRQKLATSVDLSYEGEARGEGSIWFYASPAEGVSLPELESSIEKEFRNLIVSGVPASEIDKAKTRLINSAIYARDSVVGPAMTIGQTLAMGGTLEDAEYWPQRIKAVEKEDVDRVLKTYLDPDHPLHAPVTGYLLPQETKK